MAATRRFGTTAVAAVLLAGAAAAPALAATIPVTTHADELTGGNGCSLREAISAANNDDNGPGGDCAKGSGSDTIRVPGGATHYKLTLKAPTGEDQNRSGDLDVQSDMLVVGTGGSRAIVDATGLGDRVFDVLAGNVQLTALTVTGGHARDGAVGAEGPDQVANSGLASGGSDGRAGAAGGGIQNAGVLTLTGVVVTGNTAGAGGAGGAGGKGADASGSAPSTTAKQSTGGTGGPGGVGGGIANTGTLTAVGSTIALNAAGRGGSGGAAGSAGSGTGAPSSAAPIGISGADAHGGTGGFGAPGGGIYQGDGATTLEQTSVTSNTGGAGGAGGAGGPAGAGGPPASSAPAGATAMPGPGGSSVGGAGRVGGNGGGLEIQAGALTIVGSTIQRNVAGGGGGGGAGGHGGAGGCEAPCDETKRAPGGSSTGGPGAAGGAAGGVESFGSGESINRSTIARNAAGNGGQGGAGGDGGAGGGSSGASFGGAGGAGGWIGGLSIGAPVTDSFLTNLTIAFNLAGAGGAGAPPGSGQPGSGGLRVAGAGGIGGSVGGFRLVGVDAALRHATVAFNSPGATGTGAPPGGPGGIGGIEATNGAHLDVDGTILDTNDPKNCSGSIIDVAANLDYPTADRCLGNAFDADPQLGPLQDNGGPAPTMDLPFGSPALDQVQTSGLSTCAANDERGVTRPQGPLCDIGAVERSVPSATTGAATALTIHGAHLAGTANPGQLPATYRFEYGKSYVYTAQTKAAALAAGSAAVPVAANLAGLQPGTLYHYRLTVTNPDGVATGADRTFRTKPAPDHAPPKLSLSGPKTQALAATVAVDVNPIDEVCMVAATGDLVVQTAAGKQTTFELARAADELGTGGRTVLRPGIAKAARDAARAALAHGGSATAHLKVVATDTADNRATKTRDVRLTAQHGALAVAR